MTQKKRNPKASIALAAAVAILAIAGFVAAFYFLDGMSLVEELLGWGGAQSPSTTPKARSGTATRTIEPTSAPVMPTTDGGVSSVALQLPSGMPEEFALRIWQEQIDSQANIERLASGEVERLTIDGVAQSGDRSVLAVTVEFEDGTSAPGKLGFRRFGDVWYASWVSGMRKGDTGGMADDVQSGTGLPPGGELPDVEDVDIELLNTILAEHVKSAAVTEEYATGVVESVAVEDVVPGHGTVTLKLEMDETHEEGYGDVIIVSKEIRGRTYWFIARFTKTAA